MVDVVPQNTNKDVLNNVGDSVSSAFSNASEVATNNKIVQNTSAAVSSAASSVTNAVSNISIQETKDAIVETLSDNTSVLFLLIVLLVIASVVGYIIYYIITDTVLYQQKILIPGSDVPLFCNQLTELPFKQKLESGNGKKRSYCFWIYIFNINSGSGRYRHVAHISNNDNNKHITNASPHIILDKDKNTLHIRFALNNNSEPYWTRTEDYSESSINDYLSNEGIATGFSINYVPIQRWVHVGFVINDIGGGSITTYIDGNYYETLDRKKGMLGTLRLDKLNLDSKGTLLVGGQGSGSPYGFSGLLSKFTMFNYDLNKNDMYKEYRAGPINGMLASLGIGAYGLRNPIYKLKAADVEMRE
jgi:hypothetical protein